MNRILPGSRRLNSWSDSPGFTLVEMAVVVAVLALLFSTMFAALSAQIELQRVAEAERTLKEIREALMGFASVNGRLPCPAMSATDGREKANCSANASDRHGFIPWATLGVTKADPWNNIFRYSVTPAYASVFNVSTLRDITVRTRLPPGMALSDLSVGDDIPAAVLSHGKNGYGGTSSEGYAHVAPPAANLDEITNATNARTFISRVPASGGTGGEFDDIVVWIPTSVLLNRMIAAGRLP